MFSDLSFTIPLLVAVAITAVFAFALGAPAELVLAMLGLGGATAYAEYAMRKRSEPRG
jgi:amino acid transporter